jgi:hypothetical protein
VSARTTNDRKKGRWLGVSAGGRAGRQALPITRRASAMQHLSQPASQSRRHASNQARGSKDGSSNLDSASLVHFDSICVFTSTYLLTS